MLITFFAEALESLWRNRLQSGLTALGLVAGITSVTAVAGLSVAVSDNFRSQLSDNSAPTITVTVDPQQGDPAAAALSFRDALSLEEAAPNVISRAVPMYFTIGSARFQHTNSEAYLVSTSGDGDRPLMSIGRYISDDDVQSASEVCVISDALARTLFEDEPPLGKIVRVDSMSLTVVGVRSPRGGSLFNAVEGSYLIAPYTTFRRHALPVYAIALWPTNETSASELESTSLDALATLKGSNAHYIVQATSVVINRVQLVITTVEVGLGILGSISLVVAGIGIMNIMLIAVSNRRTEIGIRKTVGASSFAIAVQFLMEALVLAIGAGGVGVLLGLLAVAIADQILDRFLGPTSVSFLALSMLGLTLSLASGISFGLYPALRASRLQPIEAIRQ